MTHKVIALAFYLFIFNLDELQAEVARAYVTCPDRCTCEPIEDREGEGLRVRCSQAGLTTVPADIPNIATELDLSVNHFTGLPANSFAGLNKLKTLTLRANNITNTSANSFSGLQHLNILIIDENRMISVGLVDHLFSSLTSLTELRIKRCQLKYINVKAFLNLNNLLILDMKGNLFASLPDFTFEGLAVFPKLQTIKIGNNVLKSISIRNVSKLPNLIELKLPGNKIDGICLPRVHSFTKNEKIEINAMRRYEIENMTGNFINEMELETIWHYSGLAPVGLKILLLSNNKISILTANCFTDLKLNSLEELYIAQNYITKIDALAFNELTNLKYLSLASNPIAICENYVFSPAISLKVCDLSKGTIENLNLRAFENLNKLSVLILDFNNLSSIPEFFNESIPTFRRLTLIGNKISSFVEKDESVFTSVSRHMTELCLDKNLFVNLTAGDYFRRFPDLRILSMRSNKIRTIYPSASSETVLLQSLDVSNNPITVIHDRAFSMLQFLFFLDLSRCQLNTLNVKAFINMSNLVKLRLDYNNLIDIPRFIHSKNTSILPNLTSLSMANNKFMQVSLKNLISLPNLQTVTLDENGLRIPLGALEKLSHLRRLSLVKCKVDVVNSGLKSQSLRHIVLTGASITGVTSNVFEDSPMLRTIEMAGCTQDERAPKHQTFRNMIHLERVDLSNTGIIPHSGTFSNSTNIKYLNLNRNLLGQLDRNIFQEMTKLESLMLRETGLNSVNYTSLPERLWAELHEIDLSKNPYVCDCGIVWFRHWLWTTNITIMNIKEYTCEFPVRYRHTNIQLLMEPTDLECFTPSYDWIIVSIFTSILAVVFVSLLLSLLYRYRWHVRYWQSIVTVCLYTQLFHV